MAPQRNEYTSAAMGAYQLTDDEWDQLPEQVKTGLIMSLSTTALLDAAEMVLAADGDLDAMDFNMIRSACDMAAGGAPVYRHMTSNAELVNGLVTAVAVIDYLKPERFDDDAHEAEFYSTLENLRVSIAKHQSPPATGCINLDTPITEDR